MHVEDFSHSDFSHSVGKKTSLDTIDDLNTHGCDEFFTMRKLIMSKSMAYPLSEEFRATHSQLAMKTAMKSQ